MKKYFTVLAALVLAVTLEARAEETDSTGTLVTCTMQSAGTTVTWTNELKSTAKITVNKYGNITGTYTDGSGSGASGPLVGFCNGSGIAFTVGWTGFSTITSWTGTWNGTNITTLWYLVNGSSTKWNNTNAGTDTFTKK